MRPRAPASLTRATRSLSNNGKNVLCPPQKYMLLLRVCLWVQLGYEVSFSSLPLCVLCTFSAPNILFCFPKMRNRFSLHILKCDDSQLGSSVVNRYLWETKQMPLCYVCAKERERKKHLCSCITLYKLEPQSSRLVQVPSQMRSGQLINYLHQIYLMVIHSFHRDLVWSFLTTSRVAENSAFPLTELLSFSLPVRSEISILFALATLNLLFGWLKTLL